MRCFIDTNIFILLKDGKDCLARDIQALFSDYENRFYMSTVCVQEAIHLYQIGKLSKKIWRDEDAIFQDIDNYDISIVPISRKHLEAFAHLELVKGHNDPNDRLIIAQAIADKMPIISSDRKFECYRKQGLNFIYNKR